MEPNDDPKLSWSRQDIEQRLLFRGGKHTRVNNLLSALLGLLLAVAFYAALISLPDTRFAQMFTRRGVVPYFIVFFSGWSLAIVWLKWRKLTLQRQALRFAIVPDEHDFVLSPATVDSVLDRIYRTVDDPKQFVLYNRIMAALSNLQNLGRIGDIDDILRSHAELDESAAHTSYSLVGGFVWAIPVLGFIGTVIGLSVAIGGFGEVLQTSAELDSIKSSLRGVTAGLAVAFETTLEALVAALAIQLLVTVLKKSEHEFLDECTDYCSRNIVNKLRLMPFHAEPQE